MRYTESAPAAELSGTVRFWRLTGEATDASAFEPIPPDGCVEIIVHLGDPFVRLDRGVAEEQPRTLLAGPGTSPALVAPTGRIDVIGARLAPGAAASLLTVPVCDVVDHIPALEVVVGAVARGLAEELADPGAGQDWTDVLNRRLRSARLARHPLTALTVERIRRTRGQTTVDRLTRDLGISPRQLERHFQRHVGYGPKMLLRIERFQAAWRLHAACPEASLAEIAARTGYYDQSHLVRDFRQLTGEVPSSFLTTDRELTPQFRA